MSHRPALLLCLLAVSGVLTTKARSQSNNDPVFGPYNARFIADGLGYASKHPITASPKWSIATWMEEEEAASSTLIAGFGHEGNGIYLAVQSGKLSLSASGTPAVSSDASLQPGEWHFLAATYDGAEGHLYLDGTEVGHGALQTPVDFGMAEAAPVVSDRQHFSGLVAGFSIYDRVLTRDELKSLGASAPATSLITFDTPSQDWPVQTRAQAGYRSPQDPSTLPKSKAPPSKPVAKPILDPVSRMEPRGEDTWAIQGGWQLAAAGDVHEDAASVSTSEYSAAAWLHATVPGTVLTTYIDRGIFPDPDYGLNNLAIPERLSRQDYWYRVEFTPPANLRHRQLTLTFNGINYAAIVWLNGKRLGMVKGAFIRGAFDVTEMVKPGEANVLAVAIAPPPHPGIPQEQSVKAGPGENGGILCLDGPTFVATEGWDWIPGIRDRNTGIWQDVTLHASGVVHLGDPQVVTALPLPDTSRADVLIAVPLHNSGDGPVEGTLEASFEGVKINRRVTADPGDSVIRFTPAEFHQLEVDHPRLWWPNGYGKPELYHLTLKFQSGAHDVDTRSVRFGIREVTYELSLLDETGHIRRVEISPTEAAGQRIVNVLHEGMVQTAQGWVASLVPRAENSPAVHAVNDSRIAPYLAIKVNGVRIAAKGGNWGMDDSRKRVSREHLEPFFRLHRDANLNIIRNWVGQDTEEVFYDLADEYGLMVWNDFWDSTENYNLEPDDSALFLNNAKDVILRFRNHPSIVMWCGRNEGVPAPAVNAGLDELVRGLDGTRYYSPSSNSVNLQFSGPYRYQNLSDYFTKFGKGFAVELGVPSLPTIDAFKAFVAPADQWPPNDVWAYHDWHFSGNGVIKPFMDAVETEFGAGKNLEDFERKAQILNYDAHRAIFEGFNAHLWNPNSGRMLWMTQPAWPSTMWQIFSSDYDTQASYYGVKKASEFIHVQMNLPDLMAAAVNETSQPLQNVTLRARVFSRTGTLLRTHEQQMTVPASSESDAFPIAIPAAAADDLVFVKLELTSATGQLLSENFYSQASKAETYRQLNDLAAATIVGSARTSESNGEVRVDVVLTNQSSGVAVMSKLTLRHADGSRVLPAYYSDNYVSLLPGEKRTVTIEAPRDAAKGALTVGLTGWNAVTSAIPVTQ